MKSSLRTAVRTVAAGAALATYAAYRKDIKAADARIKGASQVLDSPAGPIEFAESGDGPAVLVIHGAGGGFDQGVELGRSFFGEQRRTVAPSRFGYLGTPLRADSSPEAQADAYIHVLDALQLGTVPVVGASAGGPSAIQFCLRHPQRCSALVLVVPMTFVPDRPPVRTLSPWMSAAVGAILSSDFLFWTATKVAHSMMVSAILGIPPQVYRQATPENQRIADRVLQNILPVSRRSAGIRNETVIASELKRYPLEEINVPTLVIGAADCLYETYEGARYTAEHIRGGRFIGFSEGGHLLLGHEAEVRSEIEMFLRDTSPSGETEQEPAVRADVMTFAL